MTLIEVKRITAPKMLIPIPFYSEDTAFLLDHRGVQHHDDRSGVLSELGSECAVG
jgi:hypothetical protein